MRAAWAVLVAAGFLLLSACGSTPESEPNLFGEYSRSNEVKNDKFPSGDASGEDRLANFASRYNPEQLQFVLLAATPCSDECDPDAAVRSAAASAKLFERSILVKRADGSLELLTLYVAQRAGGSELIDSNGQAYGGLEDFRENNDLLTADDWMMAPKNLTAVPGEGEIVTVTGHTATNWLPWLLGGLGALVLLAGGVVVTRRMARR